MKLTSPSHRRLALVSAVALCTLLACYGSSPAPTAQPNLPAPVKWRQTIGSSVISPPAVVEGRLIFLNEAGNLEARDAATGALLWTHTLNASSKRDTPAPVDSGLAFCVEETDAYSRMVAIDTATGQSRWQMTLTAASGTYITGAPGAAAGRVYAESAMDPNPHTLRAADVATGSLRWETGLNRDWLVTAPAVADGFVVIGVRRSVSQTAAPQVASGNQDLVRAFDAATGQARWEYPLPSYFSTGLTAAAGRVYAGTHDGQVVALDLGTGAAWTFTGSGPAQTAAVDQDRVYFGDQGGTVHALRVGDGSVAWEYPAGTSITSPASVSGGRVYIDKG